MIVFNGSKFVETLVPTDVTEAVSADIVIFVASWETRATFVSTRVQFEAKRAILLSFENDDLPQKELDEFLKRLSSSFDNVSHIRIPAATNRLSWGGELQRLFDELAADEKGNSIAVDYTCLPKAISQTLFRAFIRKGAFARTTWMYSLGTYDETAGNLSFSQGVRKFFPIKHTPGDGGMSPRRAAIVGLGSDEGLVVEFLEQFNFDRVFILSAQSENSPGLRASSERLTKRLIGEGRVFPEDFHECDASSVIAAINTMYQIISTLSSDTSVDILSAGPKSHAVAACVIAEKFNTVRLMGREAKKYARYEVPPEGTISLVQVTDYKNPAVRFVL